MVQSEEPLAKLKRLLTDYPKFVLTEQDEVIWVTDEGSYQRLNYVRTESRKEWEDQVVNLAKLLVDGLRKRSLKRTAKILDCYDPKLGSIKLLGRCLSACGTDQEVVDGIVGTLGELWDVRSRIVHSGEVFDLEYRKHFRELVERCYHSFESVAEIIGRNPTGPTPHSLSRFANGSGSTS